VIVQGSPVIDTLFLILVSLLIIQMIVTWPAFVPWTSLLPVVVLAGMFLPPRWFLVVLLVNALLLEYAAWFLDGHKPYLSGSLVVFILVAAMMNWLAVSRARLGVQGTLGESMLVDLRDSIRGHARLPALPEPWHAEVDVESAYDEPFTGDFAVSNLSDGRDQLEIVLVDVSGKGLDAGTRALLLSGAFGGLLGAMDPDHFMDAANSYLFRQDWSEGFATAIHLALELETGEFSLGGAGHPPAVKYWAGAGRWQVLDAENGPALGITNGADFPRSNGRLLRGDALLLYTDGVIETRTRDLTVGIDRMLGAAERLLTEGFEGGASRICAAALAGQTDDRAVVLIWRT
jgi:hypothetical protein